MFRRTIPKRTLQNEIDATIKYFAAHNPTKINVNECKILSEK